MLVPSVPAGVQNTRRPTVQSVARDAEANVLPLGILLVDPLPADIVFQRLPTLLAVLQQVPAVIAIDHMRQYDLRQLD